MYHEIGHGLFSELSIWQQYRCYGQEMQYSFNRYVCLKGGYRKKFLNMTHGTYKSVGIGKKLVRTKKDPNIRVCAFWGVQTPESAIRSSEGVQNLASELLTDLKYSLTLVPEGLQGNQKKVKQSLALIV